jgi:protein-S-isoprenylcysteine O-methyltransferase Ste14
MKKNLLTPRVILQLLLFIVVVPFLPLLISRDWGWWEAWTFAFVSILGFVISRILAARKNPDIISERARMMQHEDTQPWDKRLAPLLGIGGVLMMIVPGLDQLLGWSPAFSTPLKLFALVLILAGYALGAYALIENHFFSGVVRLQSERGHHVVSGGPYAWVRHPGYAGALLTYFVTPVFLDSYWTFLPFLFVAVVMVIRTHLEDRFLQEALEGYKEYAQKVRYRLLPGVW